MDWRTQICPYLPQRLRDDIGALGAHEIQSACNLRLLAGQNAVLEGRTNRRLTCALSAQAVRECAAAMLGHALHAHERELREGFATLQGGHRAGFCGRMDSEGRLADIGAICVRIAREIRGAVRPIQPLLLAQGAPNSVLIVSPPGLGKTTMLRDAIRTLSAAGVAVGVADERSELAACERGVPQLDLGANAFVIDGCAKAKALRVLLRASSPSAVATDEIGGAEDCTALADAARSGVCVLATLHGAGWSDALQRLGRDTLAAFDFVAVLGGGVGRVAAVYDGGGKQVGKMDDGAWRGDGMRGVCGAVGAGDARAVRGASGVGAGTDADAGRAEPV